MARETRSTQLAGAGQRDAEAGTARLTLPPPPPPPPPTAIWTTATTTMTETQPNHHPQSSPSRNHNYNHDDSFTTAFESPAPSKQPRWGSETLSEIHARLAAEAREGYGQQHRCSSEDEEEDDDDEEEEDGEGEGEATSRRKIPGLTLSHLRDPPPARSSAAAAATATAAIASAPPNTHEAGPVAASQHPSTLPPRSPIPNPSFHRDGIHVRKSVEPETPRHLLRAERDGTPAFEDRSPSPSPPPRWVRWVGWGGGDGVGGGGGEEGNGDGDDGDDGDMDVDVQMEEASPLAAVAIAAAQDPPRRAPGNPASSGNSSGNSDGKKKTGNTPRHHSRSRYSSASKASPTTTPQPSRPSKARASSRRKSAVQGANIKVEKPRLKPTPRSRAASRTRRVTVGGSTVRKGEGVESGLEAGAAAEGLGLVSTGTSRGKNKVKEAVERIEASVRGDGSGNEKGGTGRGEAKKKEKEKDGAKGARRKGLGEETSPTRRSRRLMERRGETPELDGKGEVERVGRGDG